MGMFLVLEYKVTFAATIWVVKRHFSQITATNETMDYTASYFLHLLLTDN